MNFLNPWILLRMVAGLTTVYLFLRAAITSWRVLRRFDVKCASEAQLALERQTELASAFVRVGALVQVGALALTVLSADRLSRSVRGAMCAYGVFRENQWGFIALGVTMATAFGSGVTSQLCALDRRLRGMELVRPLAIASLVIAPLAVVDLVATGAFFSHLDLGVVTSCCSAQLDIGAVGERGFATGSRAYASIGALISVSLSAGMGWIASYRLRPAALAAAAGLSLAALPFALGATFLEVAPYAFELPQHSCPFCLLRADVFGIGYPLFGAIFLAVVWSVGAALAAVVPRGDSMAEAVAPFVRGRLRREVFAWLVALAIGAAPVIRYAFVAEGRPLFP